MSNNLVLDKTQPLPLKQSRPIIFPSDYDYAEYSDYYVIDQSDKSDLSDEQVVKSPYKQDPGLREYSHRKNNYPYR